jgi:5-methylcytosine-specific restriction enzyme subunit McrC
MISYAYRRGCSNVLLLYPNTSEELADDFTFNVPSGFGDESINIKVCEVPFWNSSGHIIIEEELREAISLILNQ